MRGLSAEVVRVLAERQKLLRPEPLVELATTAEQVLADTSLHRLLRACPRAEPAVTALRRQAELVGSVARRHGNSWMAPTEDAVGFVLSGDGQVKAIYDALDQGVSQMPVAVPAEPGKPLSFLARVKREAVAFREGYHAGNPHAQPPRFLEGVAHLVPKVEADLRGLHERFSGMKASLLDYAEMPHAAELAASTSPAAAPHGR